MLLQIYEISILHRNISFYALRFFIGVWRVRFGGNNRSHFVIEMVSIVIVEDKRHMKWRALYVDISE